jgi:hypothetical protein
MTRSLSVPSASSVVRLSVLLVFSVVMLSVVSVDADTLVMRNGTRVRGELITVRNGTIEFEERRSSGGTRTLRVDRDEVMRIELDEVNGDSFAGGGRPGGMRERSVVVSANVPWNDAGIEVRAGQTIYFEATGTVTWGANRRDGPAGERGSPSNPNRPMPNRPAAALIGKVGAGDDVFFIGDDSAAMRIRNGGRLYLGINDDVLNDNRGNFRVTVYY